MIHIVFIEEMWIVENKKGNLYALCLLQQFDSYFGFPKEERTGQYKLPFTILLRQNKKSNEL